MLNDLKRRICWIATTLAGFYQPGSTGTGALLFMIAALLDAAAHAIGPSLLQRWRDRHQHELPSSLPSSQEHHHAYP